MLTSKTQQKNFFIGLNRIMLSLGPLKDGRHCPFDCAFCYVGHGFKNYTPLPPEEIVKFVKSSKESYNIIYIVSDRKLRTPRFSRG